MVGQFKYLLPQELSLSISKKESVSMIIIVLNNVRENWKSVTSDPHLEYCSKEDLEESLLVCAAWFGHASLIDYILSKWKHIKLRFKSTFNPYVWSQQLVKPLTLPLCIACYLEDFQVAQLILSNIGRVDKYVTAVQIIDLPFEYYMHNGYISTSFFPQELWMFKSFSVIDLIMFKDNVNLLMLVKNHAKCYWMNWVYKACIFKAIKCLDFILSNIHDVSTNFKRLVFQINKNFVTPLMITAQNSYTMTKILLDKGYTEHLNMYDCYLRNALHYAVWPVKLSYQTNTDDEPEPFCTPEAYRNQRWGRLIIVKPKLSVWTDWNEDLEEEVFWIQKKFTKTSLNILKLLVKAGCDLHLLCSPKPLLKMYKCNDDLSDDYIFHFSPFSVLLFHINNCAKVNDDIDEASVIPAWADTNRIIELLLDGLDYLFSPYLPNVQFVQFSPVKLWHLLFGKILEYGCEMFSMPPHMDHEFLTLYNYYQQRLTLMMKVSIACLEKLYALGYTEHLYPNTGAHLGKLCRNLVKTRPMLVCVEEEQEKCKIMTQYGNLLSAFSPVYCQFVTEYLQLQFLYGTKFLDYEEQIGYIAELGYSAGSDFMLLPLLSFLCSFPHDVFYRSLAVLISNEPSDLPVDISVPPAVSKSLERLQLCKNPRPLAHIARVVIYECLGRNWKNVHEVTPSTHFQEYLITFRYDRHII